MSYSVIDLFSGCGGLSYGFKAAGFDTILGIDNWKDALETFQANHKNSQILKSSIETLKPALVAKDFNISNIDVIIGGPPCQGFSIAGKRDVNDERNELYKSFVDFVKYFQPKAFIMENVPNIMSIGGGTIKANIMSDFEKFGYTVRADVLLASNYGVPQNRKRAFFVGLLNKKSFHFPQKCIESPITVYEAISDLPDANMEDGTAYIYPSKSDYQKMMRKNQSKLYNHQTTTHTEKTISIISLVPDGGNYKSLPHELQHTRNVNIAWTRLNSQKPSFTIDTGHRHHFHYCYNRVPTVRESARIQSFPDDFIFFGSKTSQYKQVGNAVPPLLAKAIAEELKKYL